MVSQPTFDFYKELQVERTASLGQITSSYRRLARLHHPDRNYGNEEQATVSFQRLQEAYDTLSNPIKRANYDNPRRAGTSSFFYDDDDDVFDDDDDGGFFDFPFTFRDPFGSYFGSNFFDMRGGFGYFRGPSFEQWEREMESRERRATELAAQYAEHLKMAQQERIKREKEAEARAEARAMAKQAALDAAIAKKERLHEEEKNRQQKRWKEMNAITKDEKLQGCLHSDFCTKVCMQKKFKCMTCSVKRGMLAFECPYCSAFLCQLCIGNFSKKRQKLTTTNAESASSNLPKEPHQNNRTTVDVEDIRDDKTSSSSSKQTTSHEKPSNKNRQTKATKKNDPSIDERRAKKDSPHIPSNSPPDSATTGGNGSISNKTAVPTQLGQGYLKTSAASMPVQITSELYEDTASDSNKDYTKPITKSVQPRNISAHKSVTTEPQTPTARGVQPKQQYNNKDSKSTVKNSTNPKTKKNSGNFDTNNDHNLKATPGFPQQQKGPSNNGIVKQSATAAYTPKKYPNLDTNHSIHTKQPIQDRGSSSSNRSANLGRPSQAQKSQFQETTDPVPPTTGITSAFVRTIKPKQVMTKQLLRPAMEQFGRITSVKINKPKGFAYVKFVDNEALRKAITASPVAVNPQLVVTIVESRLCRNCGKPGHIVKNCWAARDKADI